jgi:hypothetical protein
MAAKTFKVKLSGIAGNITAAVAQLEKIQESLSESDQKKLKLKLQKLRQAARLVGVACGRTGRMTALFVARKPYPKPKRK